MIARHKVVCDRYRELLKDIRGLRMPGESELVNYNYSFFPVIINSEEFGATRDELSGYLENRNIVTRKYFYPLVIDYPGFEMYKTVDVTIAQKISRNILCIPLFYDITDEQISSVVHAICEVSGALSVSKCSK